MHSCDQTLLFPHTIINVDALHHHRSMCYDTAQGYRWTAAVDASGYHDLHIESNHESKSKNSQKYDVHIDPSDECNSHQCDQQQEEYKIQENQNRTVYSRFECIQYQVSNEATRLG